MSLWTLVPDEQSDAIWDRFYAAFSFAPDYYERSKPAIHEPPPFVTFDLSPDFSDKTHAEISRVLGDAFSAAIKPGDLLLFLDWQHNSYRIDPHSVDAGSIPWFPDGDYHILIVDDFSFGTFGHPWQESICVFGSELLSLAQGPCASDFRFSASRRIDRGERC